VSHWSECANEQLGSTGIANISSCIAPSTLSSLAPIDSFYGSLTALLAASSANALATNPILGPLITIGIISATEDNVRDTLAGILKVCPLARKKAADQAVNFGSVLWHGQAEIERGAFERTSFADADQIAKVSRAFIGYEMWAGPLATHLRYFSTVCELRHCIVHSGGFIQGKNALALELAPSGDRLVVSIGYAGVQEIAAVCAGMVRAFNTELFKAIASRWAIDWRRTVSWDPPSENKLFSTIWDLFHSETDSAAGRIALELSKVRCRNNVKAEFGI
jgi:hypothetical protein